MSIADTLSTEIASAMIAGRVIRGDDTSKCFLFIWRTRSDVFARQDNALFVQKVPGTTSQFPWTSIAKRQVQAASHLEQLGVTRLDLLALRQHSGGVRLEQLQ